MHHFRTALRKSPHATKAQLTEAKDTKRQDATGKKKINLHTSKFAVRIRHTHPNIHTWLHNINDEDSTANDLRNKGRHKSKHEKGGFYIFVWAAMAPRLPSTSRARTSALILASKCNQKSVAKPRSLGNKASDGLPAGSEPKVEDRCCLTNRME